MTDERAGLGDDGRRLTAFVTIIFICFFIWIPVGTITSGVMGRVRATDGTNAQPTGAA